MERSLCNDCNQNISEKKWVPIPVSDIECIVSRKISDKNLRKNIVYNLQYLEYLNRCTEQLYLTSVIYTLTCKYFIIAAIGIVEGIVFHELHKKGLQKKSLWNSVKKIVSNEAFLFGNKTIKMETQVYEKLDLERNDDMNFDQMLNIAETKKVLGIEHDIYEKLNGLRKLRNKVHLHLNEFDGDNDFNRYDHAKIKLSKDVLLTILKKHFLLTPQETKRYFYYLETIPAKTINTPF